MDLLLLSTGFAASLAAIGLGGGLYEYRVVDPAWPLRLALVQPRHGGVNRKGFWIPAHVAFEAALVLALVIGWFTPEVRFWLLVGVSSHVAMRLWSAVDFIPKAFAFERAEPSPLVSANALRWTRRSLLRLPLVLLTCFSMFAAFAAACRAIPG